MNSIAISIIVPVYNAKNVICRCLESILNQSVENWELIIVDDGSSDNSGKICDEYASKDDRIKVIHKPNEGVSAARNTGLAIAKGEWITFVDSDDEICEGFFDLVVNDNLADLIVCGFENVSYNNTTKIVGLEDRTFDKLSLETFFNYHIKDKVLTAPWSKFFRRSIIFCNSITFRKNIAYGEDTVFVAEYMQYINSITYCSTIGYRYYQYPKSSTILKYKVTPQSAVEYATTYWQLYHKLAKNPIKEDVTCINRFFYMEIFCFYNKTFRKDRYLWFENRLIQNIKKKSQMSLIKKIWYEIAESSPYILYLIFLKCWLLSVKIKKVLR